MDASTFLSMLVHTPAVVDPAAYAKGVVPVLLFALLWCWESWQPFFGQHEGRLRHAGRNLALALTNSLILALLFGTLTVTVARWSEQRQAGVLHALQLSEPVRLLLALLLLDAWMYAWHRGNHTIPFLWRFHRMHHSDPHMDVTTATRFHLGEHFGAWVLRLGLIPLVGFGVFHLLLYDTILIAVTQLHHADISLGRWDRRLRWLIVTPDMHKVHHSDWQPETDSNYSSVLSVWDRLARTFRLRADPKSLVFGLTEFTDPDWQSWSGMWKTPFFSPPPMPNHSENCTELVCRNG